MDFGVFAMDFGVFAMDFGVFAWNSEIGIVKLSPISNSDRGYLFKNLDIRVPVKSEKELTSEDWNIVCEGKLSIDRKTSTAIIEVTNEQTT